MSRLLSFSPIQRHLKHSSTRAAHTCRLPTIVSHTQTPNCQKHHHNTPNQTQTTALEKKYCIFLKKNLGETEKKPTFAQ